MKITQVDIRPVQIPRKESFAVRTGKYEFMPNTYVAIRTDEGVIGYGEACPIVEYFGESQETIVQVLKHYLAPALIGKDPLNIRERNREMDIACPRNPCAKAAIDIALHDLKGKVLNASIGSLLGGASQTHIPTTVSIGIDDPSRTREKAVAAAKQGFQRTQAQGRAGRCRGRPQSDHGPGGRR